ncbi:hypothetical protein ACRRTK_003278 [Alexandromys fortis]
MDHCNGRDLGQSKMPFRVAAGVGCPEKMEKIASQSVVQTGAKEWDAEGERGENDGTGLQEQQHWEFFQTRKQQLYSQLPHCVTKESIPGAAWKLWVVYPTFFFQL